LRDPRAVYRMRLEDLVGLLRERVHRLRGRFRGGLERLRFEDLAPDFVRVCVGYLRREAAAPQDEGHAMLRAGAARGLDATEMDAVQRFREFVRPLADPTRTPVCQAHVLVHGGEVPSEGDVPFLQVDADPRRLERAAAGV